LPDLSTLPALNATLNAIAATLLVTGYIMIRRGHPALHKRCMLGALVASTAFLTSYVIYHYHVPSRPFPGQGPLRVVYFLILGTHIPLAALIVPLALITAFRGLRSQFERHVRIARWTLPLWLYVSVTGVAIYLMLYKLY
jgi:putative membrane protein